MAEALVANASVSSSDSMTSPLARWLSPIVIGAIIGSAALLDVWLVVIFAVAVGSSLVTTAYQDLSQRPRRIAGMVDLIGEHGLSSIATAARVAVWRQILATLTVLAMALGAATEAAGWVVAAVAASAAFGALDSLTRIRRTILAPERARIAGPSADQNDHAPLDETRSTCAAQPRTSRAIRVLGWVGVSALAATATWVAGGLT